jgi:hypothetical protein
MSSLLPPFTTNGLLPPGDYPLTIDQLRQSHLVTGDENPSSTNGEGDCHDPN